MVRILISLLFLSVCKFANPSPTFNALLNGTSFAGFSTTYTTPGATNVSVPAGATQLTVTLWGAGGGGAKRGTTNPAWGGGSGAYFQRVISNPTGVYTVNPGVQGVGATTAGNNGSNGASTVLSHGGMTNVLAGGGIGGTSNTSGGGTVSGNIVGDVIINGNSGSNLQGGDCPNGGVGGGAHTNGTNPGGGGGGTNGSAGGGNAGNGAFGQAVLAWQ